MKTAKTNKRALLGSVIALLVCCALLVGTTFAWFTDTATSAVNKIQAGTLDVALEDAEGNSLEGETLVWQKADGVEEDVLWEPGCTYNLTPFKIVNNGNLALKYKVIISGVTGDEALLEAIEFTVVSANNDGTVPIANINGYVDDIEGHLLADSDSGLIAITGHMKESAGNEYQGLSMEGLGITVYATQYTYETDSISDQYDFSAEYPMKEYSDLIGGLNAGKNVVAAEDIIIATADKSNGLYLVNAGTEATLDMDGNTLQGEINLWNDTSLDIVGEGTFYANDAEHVDTGYNVSTWSEPSTVRIYGGHFIAGLTCVYARDGRIEIYGGTFEVDPATSGSYYTRYMLNLYDSSTTAEIVVYGGTFKDFNPADNLAEGEGTNFVAPGYTVTSEVIDGATWYTVVPE